MAIRLLSPEVSSKIAAGEVIERPASVVKELVENALDAGATEISIEVRGGGVEYIRVADNGCGIPSDQAEMAFQRFATSKVAEVGDLEGIATLGFRGEALPSIGAVASVTMTTRSAGEESGTRLEVSEGEVTKREPQGAPPGTIVTVRQLFRSLPARRKFLKSTSTEASRVQSLVTRYALAYPEVRFQLDTGGPSSFSTSGSGNLREVMAEIYGLEVAQAMLELHPGEGQDPERPPVAGLVSPSSLDRANRSYISFFVNRRWVQSRALTYALEQAYHGFLMERRYPLAVVWVTVPYDEVDVNVHPAKTEVRFRKEGLVFSAVQQAVRQALTEDSPVPQLGRSRGAVFPQAPDASPAAFWPVRSFAQPQPPGDSPQQPAPHPDWSALETPQSQTTPRKALPVLRVLGQIQNTYVVAEGPDGMYLIDQHAAHERVMFERIRAEMQSRTTQVQSLLEPVTIEMDARQWEMLEAHQELVARMGFLIEPFGGTAYLLRGVPSYLEGGDPARVFLDILDTMAEGGGFESWEDRAAPTMACHAAIRAGKALSPQEMMELARQLEECQQPNTCPHGRPTIIHMSANHLEREFGRR